MQNEMKPTPEQVESAQELIASVYGRRSVLRHERTVTRLASVIAARDKKLLAEKEKELSDAIRRENIMHETWEREGVFLNRAEQAESKLSDAIESAVNHEMAWFAEKQRAEEAEAKLAQVGRREHCYCPECGSNKIEEMNHGDMTEPGHRFCRDCRQEFFDSVDYTDIIRGKIAKLAAMTAHDDEAVNLALKNADSVSDDVLNVYGYSCKTLAAAYRSKALELVEAEKVVEAANDLSEDILGNSDSIDDEGSYDVSYLRKMREAISALRARRKS